MAKGWKLVGTNVLGFGDTRTREEKRRDQVREARAFDNAMRSMKSRSYEDMVADAEKTFAARQAEDAALLQAYAEKKLKSKALIKRAKVLKKRQEEKKAEKAQAKQAEVVATA